MSGQAVKRASFHAEACHFGCWLVCDSREGNYVNEMDRCSIEQTHDSIEAQLRPTKSSRTRRIVTPPTAGPTMALVGTLFELDTISGGGVPRN